jgi:DNA-binding MarR family transcriptional regulator
MDERQERLWKSLLRLYDMEFMRGFEEFCQGELHALQYLDLHRNESVYPSTLSDALGVTRARVTSTLAGLRKKGFVAMDLCEDDRRHISVAITDEGRAFVRSKQAAVFRSFRKWIKGIGDEKTEDMIRLLDLTASIMK